MRPFVSDQQLLAFLLGGLEPSESKQVAEAIENDRTLRERLEALSRETHLLSLEANRYEPPSALVHSLMARIASDGESPSIDDSDTPMRSTARARTIAEEISNEKSSWLDSMALIVCGLLAVSIVGPALVGARESARAGHCAARLVELGEQLRGFALRNQNHLLPSIPVEGDLAFAGSYAIQLHDVELLNDPQLIWCPSSPDEQAVEYGFGDQSIPSAAEIQSFSKAKLRYWRHTAGGSYAYDLGYISNHELCTPSLENSSHRAILGDSPTEISDGNYSFAVHLGDGSNILFGDGRVILLRLPSSNRELDHPYLNRDGKMEAGVDEYDSVLGSSFVSPLGELE